MRHLLLILFVSCTADCLRADEPIRVGIIGLDTSHVVEFTRALNDPNARPDLANCRVVAAYPRGSADIQSSVERVPEYTAEVQKRGVEIVDSINALLAKVDCVLLETNDGRPHLEQVLPVLKGGKRCFIDKPIAGSLADAVAIFAASEKTGTPIFTASALRYVDGTQKLRLGKYEEIFGCDAFSPCALEATHPDLFWYGIHGVETLFTVMGTGCETVSRTHTATTDLVVGTWQGGRVGTFRGLRVGPHIYGGSAFTSKGLIRINNFEGYRPLLVQIVQFFRTGKPPVEAKESLEIYTFMAAADESKRQGGKPVKLAEVLEKATAEAQRRE